jgi:hypothetical protein
MAEQCGEVYDSSDEYDRDARVETIYQGWGARAMAERIVELEDEIGADVDGICTGMHADVAEAWAEIERLRAQVESFNGWRGSIYEVARRAFRGAGRAQQSAQRYRLAWLSARRRAAEETVMAQDAVDHLRTDRDRWRSGHETAEAQLVWERRENARLRAELDDLRKTTHGPRLECVGTDDEGAEVWRLAD